MEWLLSLSTNDYILIGGFVFFVATIVAIEIKEDLIVSFIKKYF